MAAEDPGRQESFTRPCHLATRPLPYSGGDMD